MLMFIPLFLTWLIIFGLSSFFHFDIQQFNNLHNNTLEFHTDALCWLVLHQEFNTSGSSNTDTGKASGSLETKYKMKELGLSVNQKWNTDNTLGTEVTVEDQVCVCG